MPARMDRDDRVKAEAAIGGTRQEQRPMTSKTRFIKSVIATAKATDARLPWAHGGRTQRARSA